MAKVRLQALFSNQYLLFFCVAVGTRGRYPRKYFSCPKMRNNYGAIQLFIFCTIELFAIAPCKVIALLLFFISLL